MSGSRWCNLPAEKAAVDQWKMQTLPVLHFYRQKVGYPRSTENPGPENKSQMCDQQAASFHLLLLASAREDSEPKSRSKCSLDNILTSLVTLCMDYGFHTLASLSTHNLSQRKTKALE